MKKCANCKTESFDGALQCVCGCKDWLMMDGQKIEKIDLTKKNLGRSTGKHAMMKANRRSRLANPQASQHVNVPKAQPSFDPNRRQLSASTIQKGIDLFNCGHVTMHSHAWEVNSEGTIYTVEPVTESYGWVCKHDSGDVCKGWKFKRNCKHIQAVEEFKRVNKC